MDDMPEDLKKAVKDYVASRIELHVLRAITDSAILCDSMKIGFEEGIKMIINSLGKNAAEIRAHKEMFAVLKK